jgi:hypothetical protein
MGILVPNGQDSVAVAVAVTANDTSLFLFGATPGVSVAEYTPAVEPVLYDGIPIPVTHFRHDWITILIFLSVILFAVVLSFSRHMLGDIGRVFSFTKAQRIAPDSRGIFQWQSTLANVASISNIGLFLFMLITERGFSLPYGLEGPLLWGVLFVLLSGMVAARHVTSNITGAISGTPALFSEYLNNIYSLYRLLGIVLLPVVTAIAYLNYLTTDTLLTAGVIIIILVFIIRIISLLIIFMRSNISIFYFILYLCALEIMPGAIIFRAITA